MKRSCKNNRTQGFVLITVLLIVVLGTALVLKFYSLSRQRLESADGFGRRVRSLSYARSGLMLTCLELQHESEAQDHEALRKMLAARTCFKFDDGQCEVKISRENGKINVNRLKRADGTIDRFRVDQLLRLIDLVNARRNATHQISYAIVPAIMDWIDTDDDITLLPFVNGDNTGAESHEYAMDRRVSCRNRTVDIVDDLLEVRGMTPQILYGTDGLAEHLTVFGDGAIDINYADEMVIQSLDEQIHQELAKMIVQRRMLQPFADIAELKTLPMMTASIFSRIAQAITVQPSKPVYRVTCRGRIAQEEKAVTAVFQKSEHDNKLNMIWYTE